MKSGLSGTKAAKRLLGAALALMFFATVPLHRHADVKTHYGDCHICAVAGHSLLPEAGAAAAVVFILLFAVSFSSADVPSSLKSVPYLRGPPVF